MYLLQIKMVQFKTVYYKANWKLYNTDEAIFNRNLNNSNVKLYKHNCQRSHIGIWHDR